MKVTLIRRCRRCGHEKAAHGHYSLGRWCAVNRCVCPRYRSELLVQVERR